MQKDYSIAEEYTLPSNGLVYSQDVNPNVKIRSMTTEEEMRRLAPSEDAYKKLCEVIDDCLVEDPGISSYDMCLADYQFLLHKLRVVTYGPDYHTTSICPFCGNENDKIVNLEEIEVTPYDGENFTKLTKFTLPRTGKEITLRMQTPRMVDRVNANSRDMRKKSKNKAGDSSFLFTLQELIETVDGKKLDPIQKERFVRKLPMMDTNYILKHAQKLLNSFGIKTDLQHTCDMCR